MEAERLDQMLEVRLDERRALQRDAEQQTLSSTSIAPCLSFPICITTTIMVLNLQVLWGYMSSHR